MSQPVGGCERILEFKRPRSSSFVDHVSHKYAKVEEEGELPARRIPRVSWNDTVYFDQDFNPISAHGTAEFVTDEQIVKKYPLTGDGKHVLLQQGTRTCVPTAITMLALDLGRTPLFEEMRRGNMTTEEMMERFLQKAGLLYKIHNLHGGAIERVTTLMALLKDGPGLLGILHPEVGSHMVVLDAISLKKMTATIRDPYHGWRIDAALIPFMQWIGTQFIIVK